MKERLLSRLPSDAVSDPASDAEAARSKLAAPHHLPKVLLAAWLMLFSSACAVLPSQSLKQENDSNLAINQAWIAEQRCADIYQWLDENIAAEGVRNAEYRRMPGWPFLRTDRFLASYSATELNAERAWVEWLKIAAENAIYGYQAELLNLSARAFAANSINNSANDALQVEHLKALQTQLANRISHCVTANFLEFTAVATAKSEAGQAVLAAAQVPDEYREWQRWLGLYTLTAIGVRRGIKQWHAETKTAYADIDAAMQKAAALAEARQVSDEPAAKPSPLPRIAYQPAEAKSASSAVFDAVELSPGLKLPALSPKQLAQLFAKHAPEFVVETGSVADRIGVPSYATGEAQARIQVAEPVVYQRHSYARWHDEVLLQLNYMVWFPGRPSTGPADILAGNIDGMIWRVSLNSAGEVVMYDSVHACGCYHLFFPTSDLRVRSAGFYTEPLLIPKQLPPDAERIRLYIEANTHYLLGAQAKAYPVDAKVSYQQRDYWELAVLPNPDPKRPQRSLFDEQGFIPGTDRLERYVLWPMAVPRPGAMRQWGRHATAFLGERHFDDARLFESWFEKPEQPVPEQPIEKP